MHPELKQLAAQAGQALLLCIALTSCAHMSPPEGTTGSQQASAQPATEESSSQNPTESSGTTTVPAADQPTADQQTSAWESPRAAHKWCAPPIPENESFPAKVKRILFGRDWCGIDAEDTALTAGGAGGP